jgi:hypothetical protein
VPSCQPGLRVGWVEDEREAAHEADQPASDAPDGYEGDRTLEDLELLHRGEVSLVAPPTQHFVHEHLLELELTGESHESLLVELGAREWGPRVCREVEHGAHGAGAAHVRVPAADHKHLPVDERAAAAMPGARHVRQRRRSVRQGVVDEGALEKGARARGVVVAPARDDEPSRADVDHRAVDAYDAVAHT